MKLQDFWKHVNPAPADMCWEWGLSIGGPGYGVCWVDGKCHNAHKLAYALSHGPVPKGQVVRHSCHNRKCCNPSHLSVGTRKDNAQDAVKAGRQSKGETHGSARLTDAQIEQIRRMASYRTQQAIAKHFGVNQCQISRIINKKRRAS